MKAMLLGKKNCHCDYYGREGEKTQGGKADLEVPIGPQGQAAKAGAEQGPWAQRGWERRCGGRTDRAMDMKGQDDARFQPE